MRRLILTAVAALTIQSLALPAAWAGKSPLRGDAERHRQGNSLSVSGKVAGLGNEEADPRRDQGPPHSNDASHAGAHSRLRHPIPPAFRRSATARRK